jgi:hypothetical protein
VYATVKDLVGRLIDDYTREGHPCDPDWYGYTILIQDGDTERTLDEIRDDSTLLTIPWEGIMPRDGFFITIYSPTTTSASGSCFRTHPG